MTTGADLLKLIEDKGIKYVDLRFTDTKGKEQHVTVPTRVVDDAFFEDGKGFDGSSIAGWKGIQESDMILMPDPDTAVVDPFFEEPTLLLRCDIVEPSTMQGYVRDPRSLAKRAEAYLKSTGIADASRWGPENEFFIFDSVRHGSSINGCFYEVDSAQGAWNSGTAMEGGNLGHRPGVKGGYFPVPPVDTYQDLRSAMCGAMEQLGLEVEVHHAEVATGGQAEINVSSNTLVKKADEVQVLKYAIHNVAAAYGKTATFMPKPIVGDNGNGMHVNQSLSKDGKKYLPFPQEVVERSLMFYEAADYADPPAIKHPDWPNHRIDFQPFPFPSYTDRLVQLMKQTSVEGDAAFLAALDTTKAHADLVDDRFARAAIAAVGGAAKFGISESLSRAEVLAP